ncbi:heme o synthase [Metabacillus sediminilitoris]|uniref:Protoheme IX farnesyltransferase n=1 Tax=Metabacillus sediminilitoris TaxID=2567941 RepID=A0A4S4C7A7_9BACI|nr:heme o synthase [Metabacillus sediminilitoris]QGQ46988.1 protoheme IX farnesyltransferase [Metabacillus sediminilitoris]THF83135.1 protoheme IX farnesyltransferase [Metabacillus sediminilitoris]
MADTKVFDETSTERQPHDLNETTLWKDFLSLIKVGIVNSNAITTFTGIWLALYFSGKGFLANIDIVLFTLIGSSLVIAGSCAINNYYDRDIDHLMERTKERPTVTGKMYPLQALWVGISLLTIGLIFMLATTITATIISLVGVVTYVFLYTMWSKRLYTINTVIGSVSGAVPPLIGWAAVDADLSVIAWVLFLIMFIWQPPHFLALAMRRTEEYRAANIPMLPVVHGFDVTKRQIMIWIACLLPLPLYLYQLGNGFVIFATVLNIVWFAIGLKGFKNKELEMKWATKMFIYSINYLTILFVSMVLFTIV